MRGIAGKKATVKWGILASLLLIGLLVFGFFFVCSGGRGEGVCPFGVTSSDSGSSGGDTSGGGDTAGDSGNSSDSSGNSDNSGGGDTGSSGSSNTDSGDVSGGDTTGGDTAGDSDTPSDPSSNGDSSGSREAGSPDSSSNDSGDVSGVDTSGGHDTSDDSTSSSDNSDDISNNQDASGNTETPGSGDIGSEDGSGSTGRSGDSGDAGDDDGPMMTMSLPGQTEPPTGTPTPEEVTVPEYQIPDGSAYIIGSEDTVYYNTATQNAIQQAIEAAKATAASQVTIIVNNGVYTGGIQLIVPAPAGEEGEGSSEPASKMLLQIIAADAYTTDETTGDITPNTNSAGGVEVEGDLNFEGIDVLLAGLYLSLRNTINVKCR